MIVLFEMLWRGALVQFLMWEPLCKADENDHVSLVVIVAKLCELA